jgi:hypothetical protein
MRNNGTGMRNNGTGMRIARGARLPRQEGGEGFE